MAITAETFRLLRSQQGELNRMIATLDGRVQAVWFSIRADLDSTSWWELTPRQRANLAARLDTVWGAKLETIAQNTKTAAQAAANAAWAHQKALAESQVPTRLRFNRPDPTAQYWMEVRTQDRIESKLRPLTRRSREVLYDELRRGMVTGSNPREIARKAVRRAANLEDAIAGGMARALNIARTEVLDAYRESAMLTELDNQDVLEGWVWVAKLGAHTCRSCWAKHGSVHKVDEPGPNDHPQGRCARVPKTKAWKDLGIDGVEDDPLPDLDPMKVFKKLPEDQQRMVLGDAGFEAWKSGRWPISKWSVEENPADWRPFWRAAKPPKVSPRPVVTPPKPSKPSGGTVRPPVPPKPAESLVEVPWSTRARSLEEYEDRIRKLDLNLDPTKISSSPLSDEAKQILKRYSSADYAMVNDYMRTGSVKYGDKIGNVPIQEFVDKLTAATRGGRFTEATRLVRTGRWREVSDLVGGPVEGWFGSPWKKMTAEAQERMLNDLMGKSLTNPSVLSTSAPRTTAKLTTKGVYESGNDVVMNILVPEGAEGIDLAKLAFRASEKEVLLPPGVELRIVDAFIDQATSQLRLTVQLVNKVKAPVAKPKTWLDEHAEAKGRWRKEDRSSLIVERMNNNPRAWYDTRSHTYRNAVDADGNLTDFYAGNLEAVKDAGQIVEREWYARYEAKMGCPPRAALEDARAEVAKLKKRMQKIDDDLRYRQAQLKAESDAEARAFFQAEVKRLLSRSTQTAKEQAHWAEEVTRIGDARMKARTAWVNTNKQFGRKWDELDVKTEGEILIDLMNELGLKMGQNKVTWRKAWKNELDAGEREASDALIRMMERAEQLYPERWLDDVTAYRPVVVLAEAERGVNIGGGRKIVVSEVNSSHVRGIGNVHHTAIHELGHSMEYSVDGLAQMEWAFLYERASLLEARFPTGEMRRLMERPTLMYRTKYGDEMAHEDEFKLHYTGKEYEGSAWEVFTTGIESLWAGSGYLDRDFRRWLLGVLTVL